MKAAVLFAGMLGYVAGPPDGRTLPRCLSPRGVLLQALESLVVEEGDMRSTARHLYVCQASKQL